MHVADVYADVPSVRERRAADVALKRLLAGVRLQIEDGYCNTLRLNQNYMANIPFSTL